ncbi:MAG TPA: FixH family protein [Crocinitomicaceae bacterium]|nr:FixH family protein [Crocinitomicaceae bacterium]
MKMNWGKGLTLAMLLFIGFIVTLTWIKLSKVSDLEDENYYEREINYEQEIQAERNANAFEKISIGNDDKFLIFTIPSDVEMQNAIVKFIRPSDKKLDKIYPFEQSKSLLISKEELKAGKYKLEITYQIDGKDCLVKISEITV